MSTIPIVDDLKDLNRAVCRRLWHMASVGDTPAALAPHLIYPGRNSKGTGVSEQEPKFAFAEVLASSTYYYSVETPTAELYRVIGTTDTRARVDMSLYLPLDTKLTKVANIELKQGSATQVAVTQDVEKLVREGSRDPHNLVHGNYFQLFEAADLKTVNALFGKLHEALEAVYQNHSGIGRTSIVVCLCVLAPISSKGCNPWSCIKHFDYRSSAAGIKQHAMKEFALVGSGDKPATVEKLQTALTHAGWEMVER
jgi:hypothetical protein